MGLEEKLENIKITKKNIRNKIIDKGVYISELVPFANYPDYIQQIEAQSVVQESEQWTPDPLWWDIEALMTEDTNSGDYEYLNTYKKVILLQDTTDATVSIQINGNKKNTNNYPHAFKTSDGQIYVASSTTSTSQNITHTWDATKDKPSSNPDVKTRYIILYYNPEIYTYLNLSQNDTNSKTYLKNTLMFISDITWGATSNATQINFNKLQSMKFIGNAAFLSLDPTGTNYLASANYIQVPLIQHFEQVNRGAKNSNFYTFLNNKPYLKCLKLHPKNALNIDETTGEWYLEPAQAYKGNGTTTINQIDVSELDFTNHSNQIFYPEFVVNKIKGIIDLSQQTLHTSYTIFTSNSSEIPMEFSLILPSNADVTMNNSSASYASLKFLVENAPVLTEGHTLKINSNVYRRLSNMPYNCPVVYNGQNYGNGVQVLTLKGWTVTTI